MSAYPKYPQGSRRHHPTDKKSLFEICPQAIEVSGDTALLLLPIKSCKHGHNADGTIAKTICQGTSPYSIAPAFIFASFISAIRETAEAGVPAEIPSAMVKPLQVNPIPAPDRYHGVRSPRTRTPTQLRPLYTDVPVQTANTKQAPRREACASNTKTEKGDSALYSALSTSGTL